METKLTFKNFLGINYKNNLKPAISTDQFRPAMQFVFIDFKQSSLVVTNAHILLIFPIEITELENPNNLEGILVNPLLFDTATLRIKSTEDLIYTLKDGHLTVRNEMEEIPLQKSLTELNDNRFPNYLSVIPQNVDEIPFIGINPKIMADFMKCLQVKILSGHPVKLSFHGVNRAIMAEVYSEDYECTIKGLIMPTLIDK